MLGHQLLHAWAAVAHSGEGAHRATGHGDVEPRLALTQALLVPDENVGPGGNLEAESHGHGMLGMGAAGGQHVRRRTPEGRQPS